jgi:PAS domain S-box-containing protein
MLVAELKFFDDVLNRIGFNPDSRCYLFRVHLGHVIKLGTSGIGRKHKAESSAASTHVANCPFAAAVIGLIYIRANQSKMPNQSFKDKRADTALIRHFPCFAGAAVALFGLLVIASWHAHWTSILQMVPGTAPMQYNTALCFILSGAGLFLLTISRAKIAIWLGGAAAVFTLLTLLEYFTHRDFLIDEIFFKPYFELDTVYPGRMSPLTAVCFILIGTGIILAGLKSEWPQRLTAAGMFACIVGVIALVALFGFVFGIESAYGWGSYSRMALNTAAAFLVLGSGLLICSWQAALREKFNFLRWMPITGSVTLMVMIAFVSAVNMAELKSATFWRKHTMQVILNAQSFEENLIDLQRGARGFVTVGDTNAFASYQASLKLEPQQFDQLAELTSDNPAQQQHLKKLAAAMDDVFSYDVRVITIYKQQGFAGVSKTDANGESRRVFGNARDILKVFSQEEQGLLDVRDASEQADARNAGRLLVFGSVLAALLLVIANQMASRELRHRHRAEAKLHQALLLQNSILNSADYGIVSTDPSGVIKTFNSAAEQLLGYSAKEIVGKETPMLWRDPKEIAERAEKLSNKLGLPVRPTFEAVAMKVQFDEIDEGEWTFIRKDGSRYTSLLVVTALSNETGNFTGFLGIFRDISKQKQHEAEREKLIAELREAVAQVKSLSGMIPICGWCKNVRTDKGYWQTVEQYVRAHSDATFSHGMCPDCAKKFEADILKANLDRPA